MEKLIELLNKHRVELVHGNIQNQPMWHYNGYVFGFGDLNSQNCVLLIISKEYGFIKWLVDNDKIDRTYRKDLKYPYYIDDKERDLKGYEKSDLLVMLCSIQDNPIEFLVSILK